MDLNLPNNTGVAKQFRITKSWISPNPGALGDESLGSIDAEREDKEVKDKTLYQYSAGGTLQPVACL